MSETEERFYFSIPQACSTHRHTFAHTHTRTFAHTHTHCRTHTHTRSHTHTHAHVFPKRHAALCALGLAAFSISLMLGTCASWRANRCTSSTPIKLLCTYFTSCVHRFTLQQTVVPPAQTKIAARYTFPRFLRTLQQIVAHYSKLLRSCRTN